MQLSQASSKPVILFDIDNTLLDTKRFASQVFEQVRSLFEIEAPDFESLKQDFYTSLEESTDFTPEAFVDFIAQAHWGETELRDPQKMVRAVSFFYNNEALQAALFDDVLPNLERLSIGNTLGIFSQGDYNYQIKKIENSGIISFFEQRFIFIERRKATPELLNTLPTPATIVDDRLNFITAVSKIDAVRAIHIRRDPTQNESPVQIKNIETIASLQELT